MEAESNNTGDLPVKRRYKKSSGFSGLRGEAFEYKLCAFLYLKALNLELTFTLASNVSGLGAFDDIYFDFYSQDGLQTSVFMQLKNRKKKSATITKEQLLSEKGDYSLYIYYDAFLKVKKYVETNIPNQNIQNCSFILFTNADIEEELKSKHDNENEVERFLNTQGSVLQFNKKDHEFIYKAIEHRPEYLEFLAHFRLFYKQACENKLDNEIKTQINNLIKGNNSDAEFAHTFYLNKVMKWWEDKQGKFLSSNSEHNLMKDTLVHMAKIIESRTTRKCQLENLNLEFQSSALNELKSMIQSHKALLIFSTCRSTTFTAAKIDQVLNSEEHVSLKLEDLVFYSSQIPLWTHKKFRFLVIEVQNLKQDFHEFYNKMAMSLNCESNQLKVIFISSRFGNMQQIHAIRDVFGENLKEYTDKCKLAELTSKIQCSFLEKEIMFQGQNIILSKLVNSSEVHKLDDLDSDSLALLLANEKPKVGMSLHNTINYYIDRTLLLQDGTEWHPKHALESSDKLILVTAEPGMGKSTLMTHLACETKSQHQDVWVVLININNYTKMLHDFKVNGFQESDILNLLEQAAQVNTKDGSKLEKELFYHTYMFTGNMVVVIDGVDEVSPLYDEQVIQIIKILCKTKIKKVWITSRQFLKGNLEKELGIQSYAIMPFSERDKKSFLVKFWKSKVDNVPETDIVQLAEHILQLSREHMDEDTKFMGVPLLILMLAQVFQDRLGQEDFLEDTEVNLLHLYDTYVEKKWFIHCSEKKVTDLTNINSLEDNNILHKRFIENHKMASLVTVLSEDELRRLQLLHLLFELDKEDLERKGLVISFNEKIPKFEHRSIAEYFVARWLSDDLEKNRSFTQYCILLPQFNVVKYFLDHILAQNCPLHMSIISDDINNFTKMFQQKIDVNIRDNGGRTSLFLAVSYKRIEFIKCLLSHGADAGVVDNVFGWSSLECACKMDQWKIFMEYPEALKHVDCRGSSALHIAARCGILEMAQHLLDISIPADSRNNYNETPLVEAVTHGHEKVVKLLIHQGAGIGVMNEKGQSLLQIADEKRYDSIKRLLTDREKNKTIICNKTSDLHIAVQSRNLETVKMLVKAGQPVDLGDENGCTALWWAAFVNDIPVLQFLLQNGSCINLSGVHVGSPLQVNVKEENSEIVNFLLKFNPEMDKDIKDHISNDMIESSLKGYEEIQKIKYDKWSLILFIPIILISALIRNADNSYLVCLSVAVIILIIFFPVMYGLGSNLLIHLKYKYPGMYKKIQIKNRYLVAFFEKLKHLAFIYHRIAEMLNILALIIFVLILVAYILCIGLYTYEITLELQLIREFPILTVISPIMHSIMIMSAIYNMLYLLEILIKLMFHDWYNNNLRIPFHKIKMKFLVYKWFSPKIAEFFGILLRTGFLILPLLFILLIDLFSNVSDYWRSLRS